MRSGNMKVEDEAVDEMIVDVDSDPYQLDNIIDIYQYLLQKLNEIPSFSNCKLNLDELESAQHQIIDVAQMIKYSIKRLTRDQVKQLMSELKIDHNNLDNEVENITHTKEQKKKSIELMKVLHVPYCVNHEDSVKITDLYDILMDEVKLSELVTKIKLKVFW